jgi:hypothetical protein
MVDATDFATPESALSAATKIKIYGKLRSATGVNFVSSGAGSLTNDIQHVGASALGIYTIALAKADLSDASAAWYDQYIISLSATGAAYQTIVADGGIDFSALSSINSDIYSLLSDVGSDIIVISGILSDAYSAVILTQSMASDAASAAQQGNSRVLLVQSRLSDLDSRLTSDVSDMQSAISDMASDMRSLIVTTGVNLNTSVMSDLRSAITAVTATVSASDISDISSSVRAALVSDLSDILSAAVQTNSRVLLVQSRLSDLDSRLTSDVSDIQSAISDFASDMRSLIVTTGVNLNTSVMSDLRSAITAVTATVSASDISDIASAVRATLASDLSDILSAAVQTNSRILVAQSTLSDIDSALTSQFNATSDAISNVYSALTSTRAEPAQGTPAATLGALAKIDYLYKAWRNRTTQTATEYALYADDAVTKDHEAVVSDDGTTFERGEISTGA